MSEDPFSLNDEIRMRNAVRLAMLRGAVNRRTSEIERVLRDPELQVIPEFSRRYVADLKDEVAQLEAEIRKLVATDGAAN